MNRSSIVVVFSAVAVLSSMAAVQHSAVAVMEGAATAPSSNLKVASGEVSAIDIQNQKIVLRIGLFATTEFFVNAQTRISDGNEVIGLQQLRAGQEVTVKYSEAGGQRVSQMIQLSASDPAAEAPEAANVQEVLPLPTQD